MNQHVKGILTKLLPILPETVNKHLRISYSKMLSRQITITKEVKKEFLQNGYSQYGQDVYCWMEIFKKKNTGFFIDVGGNDPVEMNNTYYLEKKNWKGLAFEPIKELSEKWKTARNTECICAAVGEHDGEVEFVEARDSALSGVAPSVSPSPPPPINEKAIKQTYRIKQYALKTIMQERGITHVDYMSIDVEGYEMSVLAGIDFDSVEIYCIDIENNKEGNDKPNLEIREYLQKKGYRFIGRLAIDDLYVRE